MNILDRVQKLEDSIKEGEKIIIQSEARASALRVQYSSIVEEIKALGIEPDKAEEELKNIDKEIEEKLIEIENVVPLDIIEKYKNYDFNKNTPNIPDLNLDF